MLSILTFLHIVVPLDSSTLSPYSTGNGVHIGYPMRMKSTTTKEMYMANARNLRLGPNATYIPLTCAGANANCKIHVGGNANFSVFRYQLVGSPNAKFRVEGISQRKDLTQMFLGRSGK